MKKRELKKIFAGFLIASAVLTGCNTSKETAEKEEKTQVETKETEKEAQNEVDYPAVFQEAVTELAKASEGKDVDYDKVIDLYTTNLQGLVQERDKEFEDTIDQHITTALEAGKEGTMDKVVVKQIFDKLMQKVFYTTMKHEFVEVAENWGKTEEVKEEIEEAKVFYSILSTTVQKRDAANGTTMVDVINGGFEEMEKAVDSNDQLAFQLGKQVVDKTLMKTFYFATGAIPNGYATKAAAAAKENAEEAKVEQAEGWAFYQSIYTYINKHAAEEGAYILSQFDLETDVTQLDPAAVNKAFVRGFSKVAIDEYKESIEAWGEDKSVITALEGALFIDIIGQDIKGLIGEAEYTALTEKAQKYLDAAKAKDKAAGEITLKEIEATLQTVIEKAK
ncbi:hypothetical protein [Neobacillus sp. LXY-4]|uniref:hypothetical protein n=1 Tax=Neobacillus sp. LXY-4 TaxID=3379826 RepID=UPI003EE40110